MSIVLQANALLLPSMVTPTVWTLKHVVPQHTEQLFQIYHRGLGTVTEAKHIVLTKLSENSSSKNQWFDIFQHEFAMLIWLPENGFTTCQYKASKGVYIPKRDNSYCVIFVGTYSQILLSKVWKWGNVIQS